MPDSSLSRTPPPHTNHQPTNQTQGTLSRVSLALSAVLAYRLYYLWDEQAQAAAASTLLVPDQQQQQQQPKGGLLPFLFDQHGVETLGVPLGLCIAHFITTAAPSVLAALPEQQQQQPPSQKQQQQQQYPKTFHLAALLALLELLAFARTALTTPGGYTLHIDATFPVGAVYFLFVWACDGNMRRSLHDAKMGLEASRRLSQAVVGGGGGGLRAKAE